jgi:protein-S-isoprenylcysteine O-methyltransferase Ste14
MPGLWRRLPLPEQHIVGLVIGLALDRLIRRRGPRWTRPVGLPLVAAGVVVTALAVQSRGPDALDRPTGLVRDGPYAWSRNPMYLGWSLIHLGATLTARSPGLLLTWLVAVILVHRDIADEERELAERFGTGYADYAASVPRYLGGTSPRLVIRSARARGRTRPRRYGTTRPA